MQSNRDAYEGALKILNPFLAEQSEVLKEGSRVLKSTGSIFWHVGVFHERGVSIPLDVEIYSILENLGLVPRGRIVIVRHQALDPQPHEEFVSIDGYSTFTWFSKSEHFKYEPNSGPHAVSPGAGQIIWVLPERSGTCENIHHPAQDCEGIIDKIVASTDR